MAACPCDAGKAARGHARSRDQSAVRREEAGHRAEEERETIKILIQVWTVRGLRRASPMTGVGLEPTVLSNSMRLVEPLHEGLDCVAMVVAGLEAHEPPPLSRARAFCNRLGRQIGKAGRRDRFPQLGLGTGHSLLRRRLAGLDRGEIRPPDQSHDSHGVRRVKLDMLASQAFGLQRFDPVCDMDEESLGRMKGIGFLPRINDPLPAQGDAVLDVPGDPYGDGLVSCGGLLAAAAVFIVVEDDVLGAYTLGLNTLAIASFLRS